MAQTKEFFTRIMQKHDTEANWALKTDFVPLKGEIIIYDKDSTHNYARVKIGDGTTKINNLPFTLPTASSSILGGVKIGSNISISSGKISVPEATGSVKGVTIVYPAASCTTFSSDSGTVTPLAVQKGAKMFAITRPSSSTNKAITRYSNTTGDVQDSKIIIEDVTNTRDTSKKAQVIAIPAEGGKKMVYGYCTDQVDGTSFIGGVFPNDATEYPYASGLAIGGSSGNLLWKGKRVLDTTDKYAGSSTLGGSATSAVKLDTATAGSATQPVYFTGGKPVATTYTLGKSVPSDAKFTDTTYSAGTGISLSGTTFSNSGVRSIATGSTNGTISVNTNGTSANVAIKGLGSAAYTNSTAYATSNHNHGGQNINPSAIELGGTSSSHGGYIDFHYGTDINADDYTVRLIEDAKGQLRIIGNIIFEGTQKTKGANANAYHRPAYVVNSNGTAATNTIQIKYQRKQVL